MLFLCGMCCHVVTMLYVLSCCFYVVGAVMFYVVFLCDKCRHFVSMWWVSCCFYVVGVLLFLCGSCYVVSMWLVPPCCFSVVFLCGNSLIVFYVYLWYFSAYTHISVWHFYLRSFLY